VASQCRQQISFLNVLSDTTTSGCLSVHQDWQQRMICYRMGCGCYWQITNLYVQYCSRCCFFISYICKRVPPACCRVMSYCVSNQADVHKAVKAARDAFSLGSPWRRNGDGWMLRRGGGCCTSWQTSLSEMPSTWRSVLLAACSPSVTIYSHRLLHGGMLTLSEAQVSVMSTVSVIF